jgi:hypothetical protein
MYIIVLQVLTLGNKVRRSWLFWDFRDSACFEIALDVARFRDCARGWWDSKILLIPRFQDFTCFEILRFFSFRDTFLLLRFRDFSFSEIPRDFSSSKILNSRLFKYSEIFFFRDSKILLEVSEIPWHLVACAWGCTTSDAFRKPWKRRQATTVVLGHACCADVMTTFDLFARFHVCRLRQLSWQQLQDVPLEVMKFWDSGDFKILKFLLF